MRVLFVCEGRTVPATRFRVEQYIPYFERAGQECTLRYGYGYNYNRWALGRGALAYKGACALRKLLAASDIRRVDLVVLQRSFLPFSALPEQLLARLRVPFVFDFDDAVYLAARGVPNARRAQTLERVSSAATRITAGNPYLARRAGQPGKTHVVPTGVDTKRYVPATRWSRDIVIGWIGTSHNLTFVRQILPSLLRVLRANAGVRLRLVSNCRLLELEGVERVEQWEWSAREEVAALQSFDIGLMPLEDNELARGKCAFKIIQYMSVGIPVVASRVGANIEVVRNSGAGLLVPPGEAWDPVLQELLDNGSLRRDMGMAGRTHAVERYDAERVASEYLSVFADALQPRG